MSTDDTQSPVHRARVEAMGCRALALRDFRLFVRAKLAAGEAEDRIAEEAADILGQMVAEITSRIPDAERAEAVGDAILGAVARTSVKADEVARARPAEWARRSGGPGAEDVTLPATLTIPAAEHVLAPLEALVVDARSALARAEIAAAHAAGRAMNLGESAIHLKFAIHDEMKRAPANVRHGLAQAALGPGRATA